MKEIHQGLGKKEFIMPDGINIKTVDKSTGQFVAEGTKNSVQVALKDEVVSILTGSGRIRRELESLLSVDEKPLLDIDSF